MTTNYHTPITTGAAANASAVNNPMAELDEAITNLALVEKDGHIIQNDGDDLPQKQYLNFTGPGVTVTDTTGATEINIKLETLTADRIYYVRADGNDANDGLTNTSGGAFLTIQKAVDQALLVNRASYAINIQLADGTYTAPVIIKGCGIGNGAITIKGNNSTPANVVINVTAADAFTIKDGANIYLQDFEVKTTTSGSLFVVFKNSNLRFQNIRFGAASTFHIRAYDNGTIEATGDYSIVGAAGYHWSTNAGGTIRVQSKTITITGTPAFTVFASASIVSNQIVNGITFSGSATGKRYDVALNSCIYVGGGSSTYLPGNVSGTATDGTGIYA